MKKLLAISFIFGLAAACGGKQQQGTTPPTGSGSGQPAHKAAPTDATTPTSTDQGNPCKQ
jgi:hypothetical protein